VDFFSHKYKNEQMFLLSPVIALNLTISVQVVDTLNMLPSCPSAFQYSNTFRNASATMKIGPRQMPILRLLIGCHRQINAKFIKPLHSSTNPERLVKIRPLVPENLLLIGRPLKIKKKKKNVGKIYSPLGKHAGQAK